MQNSDSGTQERQDVIHFKYTCQMLLMVTHTVHCMWGLHSEHEVIAAQKNIHGKTNLSAHRYEWQETDMLMWLLVHFKHIYCT